MPRFKHVTAAKTSENNPPYLSFAVHVSQTVVFVNSRKQVVQCTHAATHHNSLFGA